MRRSGMVTEGAGERWTRQRWSPLRYVTPATLGAALDGFDAGQIRSAALIWEAIERRDDVLRGAATKRRKSVASLPWSVVAEDDSPEAARHVAALEELYGSIRATDAIDGDRRGGLGLLVRQMMGAAMWYYSVHELVWVPGRGSVGVEARCVPLYFFERTTGRLRYTGPDGGASGQELEEGGWMVHAEDGLGHALASCWMFKRLGLHDWVNFSERAGIPGIHGEIDAEPGSPEWVAFVDALESYANDLIIATRTGATIKHLEMSTMPNAPFEPLVERMDRRMAALCRGADLGTLSSQDGAGASLQEGESNLLLEDDAASVGESLHEYISRPAIKYLFGRAPLARLVLTPAADLDAARELEVDEGLVRLGVRQDAATLAERYGRTLAAGQGESVGEASGEAGTVGAANDVRMPGRDAWAIVRDDGARAGWMIEDAILADDPVPGLRALRDALPGMVDDQAREGELAREFERVAARGAAGGWGVDETGGGA
jgi:hypothetical protein